MKRRLCIVTIEIELGGGREEGKALLRVPSERDGRPLPRFHTFGDVLGKGGDQRWKEVSLKHVHT